MDCALCDILISEKERVISVSEHAFIALNIEPIKPGHLMVMPTRHVKHRRDLTLAESHALLVGTSIAQKLLDILFPDQTALMAINGWGQRTQDHLHAHVISSPHGIRGLFAHGEGISAARTRVTLESLIPMAEKFRTLLKMVHYIPDSTHPNPRAGVGIVYGESD